MKKIITIGCFIPFALPVTASSSGNQIRSSTVIARCVESHEAGLAYAYESSFKTNSIWPKVRAVVEFVITADGSVKDVEILETEGLDTSLRGPALTAMFGDKITAAAYTWRFPQVRAGSVTVEIPFLFVPVEAEETEIAESEKALEEKRDYNWKRVERDVTGVYRYEEFIIECRRKQPVPFYMPQARPESDVFARAARGIRLGGAAGKPIRDYLKEVASFLDELRKGPASKLRKKLAPREREMREVEAALADEELYVAVGDLGLSKEYNWRIKKANAKKVTRLLKKRERVSLEIEKVNREISKAEEARSRSVAAKRAALIARGEELRSNNLGGETDSWILTALGELYLDEGDLSKASAAFKEAVGKEASAGSAKALYGLGHSYFGAGDEEKSAGAFLRLAEECPASRYAPEANFRLGEHFTSLLEPDEAEKYFLLASQDDAEYRDAALYRAAWGYYECTGPFGTTYYDRAVPAFKRFLDAAEEGSEYWEHAIEMTGLCLAEWEPGTAERPAPLEALIRYDEFFAGAEEGLYSADVLRALGDAYLYKMDKLPEAAGTYEYLLEKYPSYEQAPAVVESLVETHLRREGYDDAHDARLRIADEYDPASSWYRAQDDLTRCKAILSWENALYEVAVYYNMIAERKHYKGLAEAPTLFGLAINKYNQYLTSFPTNEKAYHINFYLAESYYAVEAFETAAQQYIKTATHYTDRERYNLDKWDERFTQEQAFFNAIVARDEIFQEEVEAAPAVSEAAKRPRKDLGRPLTANEAELARVCGLYVERYPESRDAPSVLSKLGEVCFYAENYERAREAYGRIVEDYVDAPDADYQKDHDQFYVNAAENIAKSYFNEAEFYEKGGAYKEARRRYELACEWYAKTKRLAESRNVCETIERAAKLAALTALKAAEMKGAGVRLEEKGKAPPPVTCYDFVEIYPPLRPIKSSAVKAKRVEANGYEAVAAEYGAACPDVGRLALGKAADTYYEVCDWGNASRGYLDYVRAYPGAEDVKEAYERAAECCERAADWAGAAEVYKEIASHPKFRGTDFGRGCLFRAGMMYEQLEGWAKAAETFERFNEEYPEEAGPRLEATYRLARAEEKLGREDDALEHYNEVVKVYEYSVSLGIDVGPTDECVAESEFKVTDAKFDEYEAVRFVMPAELFEANLQKKVKQSQDLVAGYTYVAGLGIPKWSVAARRRLGDVYYEFAEALRDAEIPKELKPEYWEALPDDDKRKVLLEEAYYEYTSGLEEQAGSLEKKATEEYEEAVTIAEAEGLETSWSRKARERLSALEAIQ
jgi:TolA-binding protein